MPYIKLEDRKVWDEWLKKMPTPQSLGELNYLITKIILKAEPSCYLDYAELVGLLETVKLEFYRRAVAVYEDGKCKLHGDVYE